MYVIPYIHNWVSNVNDPGPEGERSANFGGLGDIDLTLKYRLVEERQQLAHGDSAMFATDFPTGHFRQSQPQVLLADAIGWEAAYYRFTTGFNISKCLNPVILYGNFWYSMGTAFNLNGTDDKSELPELVSPRFCHRQPGGGICHHQKMDRSSGDLPAFGMVDGLSAINPMSRRRL